jgi:hypothetical protein
LEDSKQGYTPGGIRIVSRSSIENRMEVILDRINKNDYDIRYVLEMIQENIFILPEYQSNFINFLLP